MPMELSGIFDDNPAAFTPGSAATRSTICVVARTMSRIAAIRRVRHREPHRQRVLGVEAGMHATQRIHAAEQQPRAGDEHGRESDLGDDERTARALAVASGRAAASPVAKTRRELAHVIANRGHETAQQRHDEGQRHREPDDREIEAHLAQPWNARRSRMHEHLHADEREQQSERAADRREDERFGRYCEMIRRGPAPRATRTANSR